MPYLTITKIDNLMEALRLATDFTLVLHSWLTSDELAELRKRNKAEQDSDVCASHDFCDANQAMIDALEKNGILFDVQDKDQRKLINQAWDLAKKANFKV